MASVTSKATAKPTGHKRAVSRRLEPLAAALGHDFADLGLLRRALTHASMRTDGDRSGDNERLEFLGDRVLGLRIRIKVEVLIEQCLGNGLGRLDAGRAQCELQ